ncbi:hypothetical protein MYX84_14740 [Acidobacteria bacterium AH-259-O06]|nr:hypothetical protein [Acidobacteria bacterium AH-259-O06]
MKRSGEKRLDMRERRVLVKAFAGEYRKGGKKEKGAILERFVKASGYVRRYAARLLRNQGRRVVLRPGVRVEGDVTIRVRRRRGRTYGEDVKRELKRIWEMLDYLCGKRLVAALPATLEALERHGELKISPEVRQKLLSVSAATIDRMLAPEKKKLRLKARSGTKPGTLLRQQVAVRTFADWDEARPGFVEVDLVAHEGGQAQGDYAQTLDLTDVSTGWTEVAAVPNKAQVWVFEALERVRQQLPFPLLGLDSDNGSEFINNHLLRYCRQEQITFTRSRPFRKNDNCFVEQKNYSVVRRYVGYARYDREEEVQLLNELYERVRLYVNFFLPSQKLKEKVRRGSRVHKRYHRAQTPYQRVLASKEVSARDKRKLRAQYQRLNPAELHRQIRDLQEKLLWLSARKRSARAVDATGTDRKAPSRRGRG